MILQIVVLACAIIPFFCIWTAVRSKGHNIGFIMMVACVAACDIICFRLLGCKSVTDARKIITAFYICQTWFYLGLIWTVMAISRRKNYILFCIPTALIGVCQTFIMISNLFRTRIMSLSRHLLFGGAWWVAEGGKGATGGFLSFHTFRILVFANVFLILIAMIMCCNHSAKIFRNRFVVLIVMHVLFAGVEVITYIRGLPVWIVCLSMNRL